jgi:hypothetical protein
VINRAFKCSFFNTLQKIRKFFFGGHSEKYRGLDSAEIMSLASRIRHLV